MLRTSDAALALHVDSDGEVWSLRKTQTARRTRLRPAAFAAAAEFAGPLRVLGCPENTELICRIWEQRDRCPHMRLDVATPRLVKHCESVLDVLQVAVQSARFAPSLGGWHAFDAIDYATHCLWEKFAQKEMETQEQAASVIAAHPLWRLVSFIHPLNPLAFSRWLIEVRDPRWYISDTHPDRTSPLEHYLGVNPSIQAESELASEETRLKRALLFRCWLTQRCWLPAGPTNFTPDEILDDPRHFLLRIFAKHLQTDPVLGIVRGSQAFLRFVRTAWLSLLTTPAPGSRDRMFDPGQHLWPAELAAYQQFTATTAP